MELGEIFFQMHAQYKTKKKIRAGYEIAQILLRIWCARSLSNNKKKIPHHRYALIASEVGLQSPLFTSPDNADETPITVLYSANTRTIPKCINFILFKKRLMVKYC